MSCCRFSQCGWTIWEADLLELNSTPAAVAKETLHCQNKVWPAHFNYASRSSFESLSMEMYTHKHSYIKTKTVTNKPQARTTLDIFSISLYVVRSSCLTSSNLSRWHDQPLTVCKGQEVTVQPHQSCFSNHSCYSSVSVISLMFALKHQGLFP